MNNADDPESLSLSDQLPQEVAFSILDSDCMSGACPGNKNTGRLIDLDQYCISLLTRAPVQPGNIIRLDHRGIARLGVVMWTVESSDTCRIQVRFL